MSYWGDKQKQEIKHYEAKVITEKEIDENPIEDFPKVRIVHHKKRKRKNQKKKKTVLKRISGFVSNLLKTHKNKKKKNYNKESIFYTNSTTTHCKYGSIMKWSTKSQKPVEIITSEYLKHVRMMVVKKNEQYYGKVFFAGIIEHYIMIWISRRTLLRLPKTKIECGGCYFIGEIDKDRFFIINLFGLTIYSFATLKPIKKFNCFHNHHYNLSECATILNNHEENFVIASAGNHGEIVVLRITKTNAIEKTQVLQKSGARINSFTYDRVTKILATDGEDNEINLWKFNDKVNKLLHHKTIDLGKGYMQSRSFCIFSNCQDDYLYSRCWETKKGFIYSINKGEFQKFKFCADSYCMERIPTSPSRFLIGCFCGDVYLGRFLQSQKSIHRKQQSYKCLKFYNHIKEIVFQDSIIQCDRNANEFKNNLLKVSKNNSFSNVTVFCK